jgi:hypothetical protein
MRTYFFKVGNHPAQAFNVRVDGLCTDDGINLYSLQKMAEYHAKLLASLYDVEVKFWPKDRPENVVNIEMDYSPEAVYS